MEISRDTFIGSDNATQNLILFDSIIDVGSKLDSFNANCDVKHVKIDQSIKRSGRVDKAMSSGSGFMGGFLAVAMSKIFGM
jgi:hypothetical protein